MSGFSCDEDRNFGENRRSTFLRLWQRSLRSPCTTHHSWRPNCGEYTQPASTLSLCANRSACQDLTATRIATLVRIAGALFYEWDNVLFVHLVLLITLKGQTAASIRSLHLLCHFVPIVVIRSKKTTTYPKCLGVVVVFMQNKNHIDGSSMWSFFLLEYNQHRYTF